MKVLIVDDENHITEHMVSLVDWERLGVLSVETADNGAQALERYRAVKPDLIVTDITMPIMDGLAFLEQVRKVDADTPVIILSGYDEFQYAKKAIHLRVLHYIMKPIVLPEIEQILYDVIQKMNNEAKRKKYEENFAVLMKMKLPVLREQFLNEMTTAGKSHREITPEQLQFYELDEDVARGALILSLRLFRTGDARDRSERDWQLFKFSAYNIVEETLQLEAGAKAYPLRYAEDRMPIFICGADERETLDRAKRLARTIMTNISGYLAIEINAGIGRWYAQPDQICLSSRQSCEMLRLSENEGYQIIVSAADREDGGGEVGAYSEDWLYHLVESLLCRNEPETERLWSLIESQMKERYGSIRFLQTASIALVSSLMVGFTNRGGQLPDEDAPQPLRIFHDIQAAGTREDVLRIIRAYVQNLIKALKSEDRDNDGDYIAAVKRIVESGYAGTLSFADIAGQLHLSRNYLGYLFKRETGASFIQYLTQFRIDKAKELMATKRYMISEIADKVGFSDPTYFSRVFRGATGKSPLEYVSELSVGWGRQ